MKLLEVRLKTTLLGQVCENVFHYQSVTTEDAIVGNMATAFSLDVVPQIKAILNGGVNFNEVYVINLSNAGYSYALPLAGTGSIGTIGTCMPKFNAFGFRFFTGDSTVKRGFKRFAGVDESVSSSGVYSGTINTQINNLIAAMTDTISDAGIDFVPIVWRRPNSAADPSERLVPIITAVFSGLTTQNSRKR